MRPMRIVGILAGLALLAMVAPASGADADWPGWRGANRDGKSPDTGLLKEWPKDGPRLLWKATDIGVGFSSVAVTGGRIYITGDKNHKLVLSTFDLDGKLQSTTEVGPGAGGPDGSRSTPVIDSANLYLVTGGGLVACLDAKSGEKKWTREMRKLGGSVPGWSYSESVLIYKNLAVVTPGGKNCIVALDKTTGETVWTSEGFAAGAHYSSCIAFTFGNVPIIVNGTGGGIVGVDARDGKVLFSNKFSAGNTANCPTPAYADGHIFWSNGYGRGGICLRLVANGGTVSAEEAWTTRELECHHGGYIIHEGRIYGNHGGGWACLDLRTGRRLWQAQGVGKGSLCWADGMLYLFSEGGGQAALATCSPDGLELKGRVRVQGNGPSWAHPVVIGGRLYLRYDSNLYCFDVRAN